MKRAALRIETPTPVQLPAPRGPMMDAEAVAAELFAGTVTETWVRRNVPGRVKLSHRTLRWFRDDVVRWLEERRSA
jgi:hypothetical protein